MKIKQLSASTLTIIVFVLLCFIWLTIQNVQNKPDEQIVIKQTNLKHRQEASNENIDFTKIPLITSNEQIINFNENHESIRQAVITFNNSYIKDNSTDKTSSPIVQYIIFLFIISVGVVLLKTVSSINERGE